MVGTSIKSDVSARAEAANWKKIAFTGSIGAKELEDVVASLGMDASLSAICAPDVLTSAESIQKLSEADCVVLVEKQEESTLADITKEIEALKAWNKTVLGAVVVGVDAVM